MEHFLKVLETEVHEKTLVHALEMLSKWGAKFTQIPKKLVDWFEKGLGIETNEKKKFKFCRSVLN